MRRRETRDCSNQSESGVGNGFGSFGSQRRLFPSLFGGKDTFNDPFFSQPFGSLFGSSMFSNKDPHNLQQPSRSSEPVIEELDSDDERDYEEKEEDDVTSASWKNKNPLVEHPEDQEIGCGEEKSNSKELTCKTNNIEVKERQPQARSVSFKRVSCGGVNGTYYSATTTRTKGNDGVMLEESKQADKTTGQATHRVSRGIHDKGHSIMRKLDSDGKVENMQMLHNLHEDEVAGFEQSWKANADAHFHAMNSGHGFPGNLGASGSGHDRLADWGVFGDPFGEHFGRNKWQGAEPNFQTQSSGGRPKRTIRINID